MQSEIEPISGHGLHRAGNSGRARRMRSRGFAAEIIGGGRVSKFAQRFTEKLNMGRRETAMLCILMLRGPQTLGELKTRCERQYAFQDLDEVETVAQKLMNRAEGALVAKLNPSQGLKEPRYAQLLGGPVDEGAVYSSVAPAAAGMADRLSALENEVAQLRAEVAELRRTLESVL